MNIMIFNFYFQDCNYNMKFLDKNRSSLSEDIEFMNWRINKLIKRVASVVCMLLKWT